MQKFAKRLLIVLSFILTISQLSSAENPPKREFRGVWFTTGFGIDWPSSTSSQSSQKTELDKYISALDNLNINTVCFQVRSMSDAMYTSRLKQLDANEIEVPWSKYISGTRGTSPGWDPLEYVITECHKRGIEVYAWINPFRWANNGNESTWTASYDETIKSKGWLMSNGSYIVLNPGIPEVRQHITNVCKDILTNYRIEGFIFDDYFYPSGGTVESSSAPDYTLWKNSGTTLSIGDWRRENVDKTVASIYNMIQETRPEVRFVAGPSPLAGASASKYGVTMWPNGYDNQYNSLYSDPISWMDKRIVDMMATQIYWHQDHKKAPYNTLTDWWYSLAKHFDLHNCVSMNVYDFETSMGENQADLGNTTAHYDEHVANIKASREYAAKHGVKSTGVNFYNTHHLVNIKSGYNYEAHGLHLRDNCFQRKSINPEIHWKNTHVYSAVNNLAYSSGKLSWTAAPIPNGAHELTTIRYTVYAIPNSVNYESAITDDGFDSEYLQGITYDPSYTLASDKKSGYWYAVCVFDGYGNEHAPAIYNYTGGTSAQVTLSSPADNGLAGWEQTFSWSAVNGATYQLLVSEYKNFSNVLLNADNLTTTSTTLNLENLVEGKTYYWKVITQESGKIATDSEIYSFEVSPLANAPLAQLESPANGESVKNDATFTWSNADEHVTEFTFQIATDVNFSNIITSQDFDKASSGANSTTINVNGMTSGTYYWRVISKGRIYIDTPSASQSFVVAELPAIEITLTSPDNNQRLSDATQHFEWNTIDGATYRFEIASDEKFSHVILTKDLTTNSYDVNFDNLVYYSSYYWRVTAYKDDYKDTFSEVRTLISDTEYEPVEGLTLESLWNFSINNEENPLPEDINANCRSMAADKNNIYITRRNSDYTLNLLVFDSKTGKLKQTISLTGPCEDYKTVGANGVFVDAGGNVCVTNIGTSATTPLTVCTVNLLTGATTRIFSYGEPDLRIDYVNFLGDVTKKGGQIWAAASHNEKTTTNNNRIYRWTNNGDETWKTESSVINSFYPTDKEIGGTPWVLPISSSQCIVDGGTNHPSLYDFKAGAFTQCLGSFDSNTSLTPTNSSAVGMAQVTVGNYPLFIYSNQTSDGSGYNFNIVHNPSSFDFSKMEKFWTIPKNPLGDYYHGYGLNSIATVKNDDGSATIYVYAPKNGLAAYRISLPEIDITLDAPADNATLDGDFNFSWNSVEGASYILELSTTSTFEKIAFSETTTNNSYSSANFNLASETKYYWRVKASHENYTATTSEVRQFTSPVKQSAIDNLTITELWNKSVNKNSIPSQINSTAQRSMVAYNGNVYVITRETGELLEFNGSTGAYNRTITLTGDCFTNSSGTKLGFPTNCIFVDGNNNLCVSNLVTSFSTNNPLTVCTIDVNTGNTTRIFQSNITESIRVDYANAFGDVTKDGAQIWASTNATKVLRWTRNSDGSWTEKSTTISSFYPTNSTSIGSAPWVMPISETQFLVDGAGNAPTCYTFNANGNATYISGFDSNESLKPSYIATKKAFGGGMGQVTLGKYPLFIYNNDNFNGNGYNFTIVHNPSNYDFAKMEYLWTIPDEYFGSEKHTTVLNSVATIKNDDNSATVFVYAPLNGLAAYRISLPKMNIALTSPSNNETVEKGFDFAWKGVAGSKYTLEVSTTEDFKNAVSKTTTDASYNSNNFDLVPGTKYYWRVIAKNDNFTTTTSSVGQFTTAALPMLPITLTSPIDNVQTEQGFDFSWTGVEGSTYTIELSTSETFDDIAFSATTESTTYQSSNFNLANSTQYYWRVKVANENYTTTTSAVGQFISPAKPTMTPPILFVPYNEATLSTDISFVAKYSYIIVNGEKIYTPKTTLEISKTEDFSEIYYSGDSNWKEKSSEASNYETWLQYTLPISLFANGTYYWRVRAESVDPNLEEGISEVRKFIVTGQYDESTTYKMTRETASYPEYPISGQHISLYNNWIRSATYGNALPQAESGNYARGFCVRPDKNGDQKGMDIIYLAHDANPNNTGFKLSMDYYNAATGEFLGTLPLTAASGTTILTATFPYNGFFVDDYGTLCFYNLTTANSVLQICSIDINLTNGTAVATERFRYTVPGRIDHCRAIGDVVNKDFILYGAASATNSVYQWTIYNNDVNFESKTISSITHTNGFGYNIMSFPVNDNLVYVDGSTSNLTLIDFTKGIVKSQFTQSNTALTGGGFFIHNNTIHFMAYPNVGGKVSHQYNISSIGSIDEGNSNTTLRWKIPTDENALPAHTLSTYGALVDYLPKKTLTRSANINNSTIVYLYVPGSGLASYSITSHIITGAEDVETKNIKIGINNQEITFGCDVDNAQIYTLSGMMLNSTDDASSIEKPGTKGVYVLRITINGTTTTHKIVI